MRLIHLPELDSTSDHLRRLASDAEQGVAPWTVVVADRQTAGHGQQGRQWISEGGGLYASILLPPDTASSAFTLIGGLSALAACQRVSGASNLGLKWVNDLVWLAPGEGGTLRGRKIGGLLAEASHRRFVILGIGINLAPVSVPDAGSLEQAAGHPVDRWDLVEAIVAELEIRLARWRVEGAPHVVAQWKAASVTLGRRIRIESGGRTVEGMAEDLDADCRLLLRRSDGQLESFSSGTVRLADGSYA